MKKNVWIFNHYVATPDMPGGSRHFEFAKQLMKYGYDVTIFASSFSHKMRKEMRLTGNEKFKIEIVDEVKFIWIKTFSYKKNDIRRAINMLNYAVRIFFLTKKIKNLNLSKPDVIIGSSVHLLAPLSAYFIAKRYNARFIAEIRDIWPQTLIDMEGLKKNGIIAKILFAIENFIYKKAEKIITLLPNSIEYFVSKGVERSKIALIPNGVNFSNYKDIREYNGSKNGLFTIMYVGAHGKANALDVIVDSAKIIEDDGFDKIRFSFVGDGPEKKNLIAYSNKLNLKNVEFGDTVPKNMVPIIMSEADLFIICLADLPLFKYGLSSNKFFDYMASGKPVIFTGSIANNPVDNAKAGISVPPENPSALAQAITRLFLLQPKERIQMGKNGMDYVAQNHDYSVLAKKLASVIEEN